MQSKTVVRLRRPSKRVLSRPSDDVASMRGHGATSDDVDGVSQVAELTS